MSSGKIPRTQHPELFHWTPGLQATDYIRATYRVASQYNGTATAMAMAIEQSAGTSMIPGYVEPGMLEHATIRVIDVKADDLAGGAVAPYHLETEVYAGSDGQERGWRIELAILRCILAGNLGQL